ncbi:hypothetical protein NG895_05460 [Aeoliella sp. ICT_H6.2]|uniref:Uncharacterized protein n=1 Tax=Aeoliella straminimaris TaxID=2954799 RepID=A0A9X2JGB6_9BACT|nr:hypothetical protein [Aeoliella straminimaris]MCO6043348.1 hypothetical protein [Aeoliella straminimaris]
MKSRPNTADTMLEEQTDPLTVGYRRGSMVLVAIDGTHATIRCDCGRQFSWIRRRWLNNRKQCCRACQRRQWLTGGDSATPQPPHHLRYVGAFYRKGSFIVEATGCDGEYHRTKFAAHLFRPKANNWRKAG